MNDGARPLGLPPQTVAAVARCGALLMQLPPDIRRQIGYTVEAAMCRNIRVLHHFKPPTTPDEIAAAALQYVRKVSGMQKPPKDGEAAFAKAIEQITKVTTQLLDALPERGEPRTREGEKEKARARWERREKAIKAG